MEYQIEGGRPVVAGLPASHIEVVIAGPARKIRRRGKERIEFQFNLAEVGQSTYWKKPETSMCFPGELLTLLTPGSQWQSRRRIGNREVKIVSDSLSVTANAVVPIAKLVSDAAFPASTLAWHHLPPSVADIPVYVIAQGGTTYYLPVLEVVRALSAPNDEFLRCVIEGTIASWYDPTRTNYIPNTNGEFGLFATRDLNKKSAIALARIAASERIRRALQEFAASMPRAVGDQAHPTMPWPFPDDVTLNVDGYRLRRPRPSPAGEILEFAVLVSRIRTHAGATPFTRVAVNVPAPRRRGRNTLRRAAVTGVDHVEIRPTAPVNNRQAPVQITATASVQPEDFDQTQVKRLVRSIGEAPAADLQIEGETELGWVAPRDAAGGDRGGRRLCIEDVWEDDEADVEVSDRLELMFQICAALCADGYLAQAAHLPDAVATPHGPVCRFPSTYANKTCGWSYIEGRRRCLVVIEIAAPGRYLYLAEAEAQGAKMLILTCQEQLDIGDLQDLIGKWAVARGVVKNMVLPAEWVKDSIHHLEASSAADFVALVKAKTGL